MPDPFTSTQGDLAPHWNTLMSELAPHLRPLASKVALLPTSVGDQIIASFRGEAVRRAIRHQGAPMPVVPFRDIGGIWIVWLGYREVWVPSTHVSRFTFSSSDLTIFFSMAHGEAFQQILRAEWAGPVRDNDGWSFRPSNAGHPHWQIDAIQVLREDAEHQAARELLQEATPKEFGGIETVPLPEPPWYDIARMHLASAMRPWIDGLIAHGPPGLASIRAWVVNTVSLLDTELARL